MCKLMPILGAVMLLGVAAQAGTTQLEFEVMQPSTIGPPHPSMPPVEVKGGAGTPVIEPRCSGSS